MTNKLQTIDVSASTIFRTIAIVLLFVLFFKIWQVLASLFLAMVISASLEPTLRWLERKKIPRIVSVPGVYLLSLATLFGVFYAILPSLFNEIFLLSQDLPDRVSDAVNQLVGSTALSNIEFLTFALDDALANFETYLGSAIPDIFGFITRIFGGILSFLLVLVFSFYLSLSRNQIEKSLIAITPHRHHDYVKDLIRRINRRMGRFMQGMFVLSTFVGITTFVILSLLDVRFALTLGILAALLEFIPFVGPFIAGGLIFLLTSLESTSLALVATGAFVLLQQVQGSFVQPAVMSRAVGFSPLYVIILVIVGAQLAGFWGVIIAIPLAAAIGEAMRGVLKNA